MATRIKIFKSGKHVFADIESKRYTGFRAFKTEKQARKHVTKLREAKLI